MSTPPFSLSFSLPFEEAISTAQARGVMLPGAYYGEQPASARRITFSVSGLTALDQVQSVKDQLTQHLKTGGTLAEFQQWAKTQDFNLPRHRLETIYRNAVQTAYNAGHWRSFEATKAARPYLRYDAVNDGRTRPAHRALSGIIRAVDDPFWDDHSPPLGHRCRCRLISLTQQEAVDRSRDGNGLNKAVSAEMQPDGPGWGNKPTAWAETLATLEKQKVEQAGETLGRIAVQVLDNGGMNTSIEKIFLSVDFSSFAKGEIIGERPIALVPTDIARLLNSQGEFVLLSQQTAIKQYREHPDITPEDYRRVQNMIDFGEVWSDRDLHIGLIQEQGKWFYSVIKTTKTGKSIYLQSLRRTNESNISVIRGRSHLLRAST